MGKLIHEAIVSEQQSRYSKDIVIKTANRMYPIYY